MCNHGNRGEIIFGLAFSTSSWTSQLKLRNLAIDFWYDAVLPEQDVVRQHKQAPTGRWLFPFLTKIIS